MNCLGFLIFFHCTVANPTVVSDFCNNAGPDIVGLRGLSAGEVAALTRPHKEHILTLRRNFKRECELK